MTVPPKILRRLQDYTTSLPAFFPTALYLVENKIDLALWILHTCEFVSFTDAYADPTLVAVLALRSWYLVWGKTLTDLSSKHFSIRPQQRGNKS